MAFHMLQSMFIIYKLLFQWCKDVIQWKNIKMNKVSDNFKIYHVFNDIILEEAVRVAIDHFMIKKKELLTQLCMQYQQNMGEFSTAVASHYLNFLEEKINNTTNKGEQLLYSFVILSRRYI